MGTMDSLNDILLKKDFDEPPEITAIKDYVKRHFNVDVSVQQTQNSLIITGKSAALVNSLRLKTHELKEVAATPKKLLFRISG